MASYPTAHFTSMMTAHGVLSGVYRKLKGFSNRSLSRFVGTITHVATEKPIAALTFDDGPHPDYTPRLLDILERYGAKATFFPVGKAALRHPDLIRLIGEGGHAIGNHTWDHQPLPLLTRRQRQAQIRACEEAIRPYGHKLFRPPNGYQSLSSFFDAMMLGYHVVTWSVVGRDWSDYDATYIKERVSRELKPGSIVLLHDGLYRYVEKSHVDRGATLSAVASLLEHFRNFFSFVTVPELMAHGKIKKELWFFGHDVQWLRALKTDDGDHEEERNVSTKAL